MIEELVKQMEVKIDVARHEYHFNNVKPDKELAVVFNMYLLAKPHFPKLYDEHQLKGFSLFMEEAYFKPERDRIYRELMKG